MSGFRQVFLIALLFGSPGIASAQRATGANELSQQLVSNRIQTLRDSGGQAGADTTIGTYELVLNWLGEADVHAASEKTYLQAQIDTPKQDAEIRDRIETREYRSPDINPASVAKFSTEEIEGRLTELRLRRRDAEAEKDQLNQKISSEQSSPPKIRARLDAIDKRLQELPNTPVTIEPDLQPSQFEAEQWSILAERKALNAERRSLAAQLASQPARFSRRNAQSNELALILEGLAYDIGILETERALRAQVYESESSADIDESTPGYGFIQQLLESNGQLREQSAELDQLLETLKEDITRIEQRALLLDDHLEGVKTLVSLAGKSASLGHELMVHWRQTDNFSLGEVSLISPETFGRHVIQRKQYEDTLNSLAVTKNYLASGFAAAAGDPQIVPDEKLVESAKGLARLKRELLTSLVARESELINAQGRLERNLEQLREKAIEYKAYLSGQILWVPSHPPLTFEALKNIRQELVNFQGKFAQLSFFNLTQKSALILVLAMGVLLLRKKIDSHLHAINKKVGRVRYDSILFTVQALLLNVIRILPVPLLLLFIEQGLRGPDTDNAPYFATAMLGSIELLLLVLILRTSCHDSGIARTHFAWPQEYCDRLHSLSTRLIIWWFPLSLLTAFIFQAEPNATNAVLGRLLFCIGMIVFTFILLRYLFVESTLSKNHIRLRFWIVVLVVIHGVFFISTALMGYLYSAEIIFGVVGRSLAIIMATLFTYFIMQRWLLVVRRRLRFREILASRQAAKEKETPEVEDETVDLVTLSDSVSSFLKVVTITIAAFWLALIWAPLFRALEVMQQITLWTVNDMSDGKAVITSITLASLLLSLLIGLFTFFAARHVPPLLAFVLRSRKDVSTGSRYAMVKLLGYLIITVGVLAFLSTLGLRWDRLQWLVAALGVGIGFGLQEIIANLICGLIILFERPIRVGDVITVGESSGFVVRIRIRATTIRDFDGKELLVPNKEFITGRLLNWTLSDTSVRITMDVGIAYGSDVRKAIAVLQDVLDQHEMIAAEPEPDVIFNKFGDSALNLTVRCFTTEVGQRGRLISDLHMKINDALTKAGIVIAFPQLDVHIDGGAGAAPVLQAPQSTT